MKIILKLMSGNCAFTNYNPQTVRLLQPRKEKSVDFSTAKLNSVKRK